MSDYFLKEWLTLNDAAAWLSETTGKAFSADGILRAVVSSFLPAHYWPTDGAQIGLFGLQLQPDAVPWEGSGFKPMAESPMQLDLERCELICLVDGPVPFHHYDFFRGSQKRGRQMPIGITAFIDAPTLFGCYRLGQNDQPASLLAGEFEVLIHVGDLERLSEGLSRPKPRQPHSLAVDTGLITGTEELLTLARSTADWLSYPDSASTASKESAEKRKEPLLRALGFAAHVIADLGNTLDSQESIVGRRKGYMRGEAPNVFVIAKALSDAAVRLKHEGHGFKGDGFQKLLSAALKEVK